MIMTNPSSHTWETATGREVADPIQLLSEAILCRVSNDIAGLRQATVDLQHSRDRARKAVQDMGNNLRRFLCRLNTSRRHIQWVNNQTDDAGLEFDDLARQICCDPYWLRESMLGQVPYDLYRLLEGRNNYTCPLCEAER